MKRLGILIIGLVLWVPLMGASDGFMGQWRMELLGSDEEWLFTRTDEYTSITVRGMEARQSVSIDTVNQTISIPVLSMLSDLFGYTLNDDGTIDLRVRGTLNVDLAEAFTQGIGTDMASNSVTRDATRILVDEIARLMYRIPVVRLVPL